MARDLSVWGEGYLVARPIDEDAYWARGLLLACRLAIELAGRETVAYFDGRLSYLMPLLPNDGGVRVDNGSLWLPGHWVDLATQLAELARLSAQLFLEVPPGHVLHHRELTMIARCGICDDVLVRVADEGWAVVHITWRRGPEISPEWPATSLHTDPAALLADVADRH